MLLLYVYVFRVLVVRKANPETR